MNSDILRKGQEVRFFEKAFLRKAKDWGYEREIRYFCTKKAHFSIPIDEGVIAQVILGCKMTDEYKKEIIQILREKPNKIELLQSKRKEHSFGLDFEPIEYI